METRTVEQVESWQTRSFDDGFAGLRELSDGEFSGAIRAGGAWLFMLNGRIIGVYEGSLDDFEDADGTAYAAPHPSLPLLFSMQERGGETQAKYYTNKTPLSEVDSTLTSGNFTGYVELSENVLSGDYYVAYYGGRSMSVAFVGASEQVVTGDDAFQRANDEVGIYEVRDVDVEVTDVPEPDEPDESPGAASGGAGTVSGGTDDASGGAGSASGKASASDKAGGSEESSADSEGATGASGSSGGSSAASGGAGATASAAGAASGGVSESTAEGRSGVNRSAAADRSATDRTPEGSSSDQSGPSTGETDSGARTADSDTQTADSGTQTADSGTRTTGSDARAPEPDAATTNASAGATGESVTPESESTPDATGPDPTETATDDEDERGASGVSDEEEWRETTTIPSLDPDRSDGPDDAIAGGSAQSASSADGTASAGRASSESASAPRAQSGSDDGADATRGSSKASGRSKASSGRSESSSGQSESGGASGASGRERSGASGEVSEETQARIRKLRSQLEQRKQQVEKLKQRLSNVESERNEYERERNALRQEVERLEAKLESADAGGSGSTNRQLGRSQAFDGTNLFVRYESKGKATLDEAANGDADASDVNANLRLEHHTQFETDDVDVAGESFEEFLTGSFEYQFVSWVVEELLYEIRDTGHRGSLKDLYDSIPRIDRVDLHGSVSAGGADDDTRQESFDVIMRDRMGNPLLLADLNGSRDPTTGEMMGSLVDAATGVAQAHDELSGAFQITESFFEPEALETAESATSGGFLSREKRESFVKLSRKRGYHLCLVESRSGGFHLNVPEL